MSVHRSARLFLALMLLPAAGLAAEVTIYRCTDGQGRLTIRDSPCKKGEQQEARTMLKPRDPPARAATKPPARAPGVPSATITRVVVVTPQRQTYECVAPDGTAYLSDHAQGELRWHAALPYVHGHHLRPYRRSDYGLPAVASPRTLDGRVAPGLVFDGVGRPTPKPPRQGPGVPSLPPVDIPIHGGAYAAGAWLPDPCQPLPEEEVCARLRDRRDELGRRYNSALQSERTRITREQRGLDARLSADCGGR
jgi:hypothetical protein